MKKIIAETQRLILRRYEEEDLEENSHEFQKIIDRIMD